MEEFLNNLYNYEFFGFYLIISIIILVLLFLIILFFGKKDQKHREIEATKKLQKINAEAFKEETIEEKLEVETNIEEKNLEENTTPEEAPILNFVETSEDIPEPILPVMEEVSEEKEPIIEEIKEENNEPLLDKIEEKPLVFDNTNIFDNNFVEQVQEEVKEEIEVPEFNLEEVIKEVEEVKNTNNYSKGPQIFSSVYVPEKKEEKKEEIELPKVEIPVEKALEDLEFELPSLKKDEIKVEEKKEDIEIPILNDYNLDELSGETYTINK